MTIRYLIVDDEPLAHGLIKDFAKELPHLQLAHQCYNALEAIAYLQSEQVDLMFLGEHEVPIGQTYRQKVMGLMG